MASWSEMPYTSELILSGYRIPRRETRKSCWSKKPSEVQLNLCGESVGKSSGESVGESRGESRLPCPWSKQQVPGCRLHRRPGKTVINSAIANLRHRLNLQGHSLSQSRAVRDGRKGCQATKYWSGYKTKGTTLNHLARDTGDSNGLILRRRTPRHNLNSGKGKGSYPGVKTRSFPRIRVEVADCRGRQL